MIENESLVKSKTEISLYLRAATETERDIYMMEETCKRIKACSDSESKRVNEIALNDIPKCKNKIKAHEKKISTPLEYIPKEKFEPTVKSEVRSKEKFGLLVLGLFPFIAFTIYLILLILSFTIFPDLKSFGTNIVISVFGALFVSFITDLYLTIVRTPKIIRDNEWYNEHILIIPFVEKEKQELEKEQKAYDEYVDEIDKLTAHEEYCRYYSDKLRSNLKILCSNRDKFYSIGIIPPDYRTIDCVYVLAQIFQNNLVYTMHDAVLLYEEHICHGELIRGIDKIAELSGKLSPLLSELCNDMKKVEICVASMYDNLEKIYEQSNNYIETSAHDRECLYEKTELYNATLEAIRRSNRKITDYTEK